MAERQAGRARRLIVGAFALAAVTTTASSGAARADDALGRALLGLGMQAITQAIVPNARERGRGISNPFGDPIVCGI